MVAAVGGDHLLGCTGAILGYCKLRGTQLGIAQDSFWAIRVAEGGGAAPMLGFGRAYCGVRQVARDPTLWYQQLEGTHFMVLRDPFRDTRGLDILAVNHKKTEQKQRSPMSGRNRKFPKSENVF